MSKWNSTMPWIKKSDYILRCVEEIFAPSNSGNPMYTLKFEVAAPSEVEDDDGNPMTVAGISVSYWCVTKNTTGTKDENPEQATERCKKNFIKLLEAFELPTDNIDWDNPTGGFKGKLVYALVEDNPTEQRGSPTKADLAKGIRVGPILLHPKTKKPLIQHYPVIKDFYGIAELATSGSL